MKYSEIALRYAKAIFMESKEEAGRQEEVFEELRGLQRIFEKEKEIFQFMTSPVVSKEDKEKVFMDSLNGSLSDSTKKSVMLLAKKGRMYLFPQIVEAFQAILDAENGVTRGVVKSAAPLSGADRQRVEDTVSKYTNKKVILSYKEDSSLIGGLVAEVGSFSFDDSLTSHLTRLNEELNRSTQ